MKVNEKILKYLADDLNFKEKTEFESELETNAELKKQFKQYSTQLEKLKITNDSDLNETYFINLIPSVYKRIEKTKHKVLIPKLAIVLSVVVVIAFIIFYPKSNDNYSKIVASLPDSSKVQIVNYIEKENLNLPDDYLNDANIQTVIESEIDRRIDIKDVNLDRRLCNSDDYEIISSLSGDEVDKIYDKMLSTKIL